MANTTRVSPAIDTRGFQDKNDAYERVVRLCRVPQLEDIPGLDFSRFGVVSQVLSSCRRRWLSVIYDHVITLTHGSRRDIDDIPIFEKKHNTHIPTLTVSSWPGMDGFKCNLGKDRFQIRQTHLHITPPVHETARFSK